MVMRAFLVTFLIILMAATFSMKTMSFFGVSYVSISSANHETHATTDCESSSCGTTQETATPFDCIDRCVATAMNGSTNTPQSILVSLLLLVVSILFQRNIARVISVRRRISLSLQKYSLYKELRSVLLKC